MNEHYYRDCFMQIDREDMLYFESLERNIIFLQKYFNTSNQLSTIDELSDKGKKIYGEDCEQTLFEGVLTDLQDEFKDSILELLDKIIDLISVKESYYWLLNKPYIYYYFSGLDKKDLFD